MNKPLLTLALAALTSLASPAQGGAEFDPPFPDGFYRMQNNYSLRYAYLCDNVGKANVQTMSYDMGAIALFKPDNHDRFSDPGSVIYVTNEYNWNIGHKNDLEAQNTRFYDIIGHFVQIKTTADPSLYYIYESRFGKYLGDITANSPRSYVREVNSDDATAFWRIIPVSAEGDEYLGIAPHPEMQIADKYYKPYIVGFAMTFESPGMKAYYVSDVKDDAVIISPLPDGPVPANTPVIVECCATDASSNRVELHYELPVAAPADNRLSGRYFCYESHGESAYQLYDPQTMRVLAVVDGKLTFIKAPADDNVHTTQLPFKKGNTTTYKQCLSGNEAYLTVPADFPDALPVMTQREYAEAHGGFSPDDINEDGRVDLVDLRCIVSMVLGTANCWPRADINADGRYSIYDISNYISRLAK